MIILKNLFHFNLPVTEMLEIYGLYIISVVEQACVVWSSSLTKEEQLDLERVQKVALRIILQEHYIITYLHVLKMAGQPTIKARRNKLSLYFARNCLKNEMTGDMFPRSSDLVNTRKHEDFIVPYARTERLAKSALPHIARQLNANAQCL